MDLEAVKRSLEAGGHEIPSVDALPSNLYGALVLQGLRVDLIEPGRVLCSMSVPPRLQNEGNYLHTGAISTLVDVVGSVVFFASGCPTSGVSIEINVSYLDAAFVGEDIEIEAKVLRAGKAIGVSAVELRKKKTGKIIAQARHTKYLAVSSKL